jgi:hypothetical protein
MKSLREKLSVTKLVLLLLVIALIFIEIWNVVNWDSIDQLFTDVVIAVISFYFWQKGIQYDDIDSLVKDLDTKEKEE